MSGVFVQATQGGHVWLDTPRGMLGGCWKCGQASMRACECYQDKAVNAINHKNLDAFHNGKELSIGHDVVTPEQQQVRVGRHGHRHNLHSDADSLSGQGSFKRTGFSQASLSDSGSLRGGAGPGGGGGGGDAWGGKSVQGMLEDLKTWKETGLIDEQEYKAEKAKLLNTAQSKMASMSLSLQDTQTHTPKSAFPTTTNQRTYQDPSAVRERRTAHEARSGYDDVRLQRNEGSQDSLSSASSVNYGNAAEPGHPTVKKAHLDFLFRQLRQICYRKVRGNGNDVSIREIFRHFDSEKHGDAPGVDRDEFVTAVKRLMLGTAARGIITDDEAIALFDRIDLDGSGTIDYRETAATLSLPGWDNKVLGKKSNILL